MTTELAQEHPPSPTSSDNADAPSVSPVVVSTGRGGAGNIRASSESRAPNDPDSGDEARERSRERSRERGHGSGRGGAGNFRSASKNPEARIKEQQAEEENAETEVGPSKLRHGRKGCDR